MQVIGHCPPNRDVAIGSVVYFRDGDDGEAPKSGVCFHIEPTPWGAMCAVRLPNNQRRWVGLLPFELLDPAPSATVQ